MSRYIFFLFFLLLILLSNIFLDYLDITFNFILSYHSILIDFVENKFIISIILFTIFYFISTSLSLPIGSFLTFMAGYTFGAYYAFFPVIIGATLGATVLFLIIRSGFIKPVKSIQKKSSIFKKIKLGIEKDIWSYLFFIRFFPIFPFWFVNIAPAIIGVKLIPYFVTTIIGIIPGTISIIFIGSGVENIVSEEEYFNWNIFEHKQILLGLVVLSSISILPIILRQLKLFKL